MMKEKSLFVNDEMSHSERSLHTPGIFAKQNLLYVQEVGRLQSLQPHRCVRENLESFLFLIVLDGKGTLNVRGTQYELSKGSCALIDCMEHYEHISDEHAAWKLAWVHLNGYCARGYFELFLKNNNGSHVFLTEEIDFWDAQIGELMSLQKDRNLQAELLCGEKIVHLLNCIIGCVINSDVEEREQEKQLANELRELLNEQYADINILQELENKFMEDSKTLSEKFSRQFGIGLEEYISNRRFNAAKELLRFSIKPLEMVAEESGIRDIVAMQKMILDCEAMTAEEYRRKWAAWIR